MKKQQKTQLVNGLKEEFRALNAAYLTSFMNLKVVEMDDLRKKVRSAGGQYRVLKNTLARLGTQDTPFEPLTQDLTGPVGWAMTKDDPVSLAKVLKEFQKVNEAFGIQVGVLDGKIVSPDEIKALAEMPSKEVLLAQILGVLNSSARGLVSVIQAVPRQLVNVIEAIRKNKEEEESKNG
jgi:large subunit ribosomal protein L10